MNLVLDTVQASHQQCSKREIGIGGRVGKAYFNASSLGTVGVGNTYCCGPIADRVGKIDRRFKTRNEALIGIGAWIGNRVQGLGVFDNPAYIIQRHLRKSRITASGK